ncbi:hypothetical protein ACA910_009009 [Epithemia clementina (nom. ined.)]
MTSKNNNNKSSSSSISSNNNNNWRLFNKTSSRQVLLVNTSKEAAPSPRGVDTPSFDGRLVRPKPTVGTELPHSFEYTAATFDEFLAELEESAAEAHGTIFCDFSEAGGGGDDDDDDDDDHSCFTVESTHIGDLKRHLAEADEEFRRSLICKLSMTDLFDNKDSDGSSKKKVNPNQNTEYMEGYIKCLAPAYQAYERRKLQQRQTKEEKNRVPLVQGGIPST